MKNIATGIFAFCGVLATLWAVSHLPMVSNQEKPPPPADKIEQSQPSTTEPPPSTATTPPSSDAAESQESIMATSAPVTPEIDGQQPAPPAEPPATTAFNDQTSEATSAPSTDSTPPSRGWGLLSDTGETEENRLDDPNAAMVRATVTSKKTKPVAPKIPTQAVTTADHRGTETFASGDLPFSLLLETYDNPENARKGVALYEQRGVTAYVAKVDLGDGGVKYRLFGGIFATEKAAQDAIKGRSLRGKPVKHTPYTALIGVFNNRQELAATIAAVSRSGAFPYVLGPPEGPLHLVVGAFYTPEGAEMQCRELLAAQLKCTVIKRSLAEKR